MVTYVQLAVGLVIAFGLGALFGSGFTSRSIDQSFRRLARRQRILHERERDLAAKLVQHDQGQAHRVPKPRRPRQRPPAYQAAAADPDDDD